FRIERTEVAGEFGIAYDQSALTGHHGAVARDSRRQYAVEHIDAADTAFDERIGRSDAHQITRLIAWQQMNRLFEHLVHHMLRLAYAQSTHSIPRKIKGSQIPRALLPQIRVHAALNDREQSLVVRTLMRLETALRPPARPLRRLLHVLVL